MTIRPGKTFAVKLWPAVLPHLSVSSYGHLLVPNRNVTLGRAGVTQASADMIGAIGIVAKCWAGGGVKDRSRL
jgi:hypothetical protein